MSTSRKTGDTTNKTLSTKKSNIESRSAAAEQSAQSIVQQTQAIRNKELEETRNGFINRYFGSDVASLFSGFTSKEISGKPPRSEEKKTAPKTDPETLRKRAKEVAKIRKSFEAWRYGEEQALLNHGFTQAKLKEIKDQEALDNAEHIRKLNRDTRIRQFKNLFKDPAAEKKAREDKIAEIRERNTLRKEELLIEKEKLAKEQRIKQKK